LSVDRIGTAIIDFKTKLVLKAIQYNTKTGFTMSASSKSSTHSIVESKHHHQQAFETFYDMRSNGELCDVTLKIGNLTLPAHKTVLAATSPYFRQLFTSKSNGDNEICLPTNIKPDMMAVILEFLYTGNLKIDIKNIEDLLDVACLVKVGRKLE